MLIVDKDGNVIAANSDDLKGLKEEGKLRALGIVGWRGQKHGPTGKGAGLGFQRTALYLQKKTFLQMSLKRFKAC